MVQNALSVDVEDWFQVGAFEGVIDRANWDDLDRRVEGNTDKILAMFDAAGVKGTFFTLGWVAKRHPHLIRRIVEAGHEIASHGSDHKRVFAMTASEFADDIALARIILEDVSGQKVTGYRAPSFSIDKRTPWAHEELARAGYAYSSSVAPIAHDHYGWPEAPRFAFKPVLGSDFVELPVTTAKFAGRTLAAGGGGFFRMLPYGFSRWAVRQVNAETRPAIIYFHPWEIDPEQPRVANAPMRSKLRHYTNLSGMAGKLKRLVGDFEWDRVDAVAAREVARLA
jgi:polysaccharide deacetylase family protein (PEP-CTERM system associated)